MFLSNGSVSRPVAMSCLIIALTLLGMNAYRKLGLELMPKMDIPFVTVTVAYPGATPADVEVDVVKRIEDAVASTDGLKHITSSCLENFGQVVIEFTLETDVDVAAFDVRQKVDAIIDDFPGGVDTPIILKVDINATPIVNLALTGTLPISDLYDFADQELSDRLSSIPGVANVDILGGAEREIHVVLDREKVAAAGLSSLDAVQALENGILTVPAGRVRDGGSEFNVRFDGEYRDFRDIAGLQVAGRDGARRYIRDLGRVEAASEEIRQASFIDGRPCVGIQVVKRADANAVAVVNAVRERLREIGRFLPGGSELVWVSDDGEFIEANFSSTMANVRDGVILTAIVLFLFLVNPRSTVVVAISMPLTIVISIFLMQLSGFTFNSSTMLALGLSVGTLVTNSIVVMESVAARLESGASPWDASRNGANDVAVAVLASAGTNMVVLLPIGLMGSMVGMVFRPFALTTLYANLASLFISFTLVPILCGVVLRPLNPESFLARLGNRANGFVARCASGVGAVMRHLGRRRWAAGLLLLASAATLVQSLSMMGDIGFSMFPEIDRGDINIKLEYPTQQNLESTIEKTREVEGLIRELPGIVHVYTNIGKIKAVAGSPSEGTFLANIAAKFVPKTDREENIFQLMGMINAKLASYPDCAVTSSIPNITGQESIPITMAVSGADLTVLEEIVGQTRRHLENNPNYIRPGTSIRLARDEIQVIPRRAPLADAGLAPAQLAAILRTNLDGSESAQYKSGARSYDIRVKFRREPGVEQVPEFKIPLANGQSVLLTQYAEVAVSKAPVIISRHDKTRMSAMYASLDPGFPLGNAIRDITRIIGDNGLLPSGYSFTFLGMAELMDEALAEFAEAIATAIVLTYLVLAASLESFTKPIYILIAIPLALIGMLWALRLAGMSIGAFVLLGGVLLIGIVVNNAVLLIDHAQQLVRGGLDEGEAMLQAMILEFRPIIMITIAAAFGMWPLAVAMGLGSEMSV
ncbi:MAG: efflux RND transporter permease subunit, partial [Planctomycetota bacterium]|nr:efflux RND transporter permease subunit [Planctomycetota bacterium]